MASKAIIETRGLSKIYGNGNAATNALDTLNLSVQRGEIFGYLGPNGAGKTTTIRLLLDLIRPTTGGATIFDLDVREQSVELHKRIGFMPGELNLWKNRTARQVVNYVASVRGDAKIQVKEAHAISERLQFDMSKRIREYSTGNKRKLGLVLALMHKPDLLILDEPTSGLDPLMQQTFNRMMREYQAEGRTIFLSSHVLSEVQAICNRVGILRDGVLQAVEDIETLTHVEFRHVDISFRDPVPQAWEQQLAALDGVTELSVNGRHLHLKLIGDFDPVMRAISTGYVQDIRVAEPSLEEIFLTFYGGEAERHEPAMKEAV